MPYTKPPYDLTPKVMELLISIGEKIGEINAAHLVRPQPELRKKNRIRTIQASLGIEGNTLSVDQITAIFEGKRVLGPADEITEVRNAIRAYDALEGLKADSVRSFLKAHRMMMNGLVGNAGTFRSGAVGIIAEGGVAHVAPPGKRVPELMGNLFAYLKRDKDPVLVKSCVFHYETEFIHPFMDGNGRMGRLWQTKLLSTQYPVFGLLPVETVIKEKQKRYYDVLGKCDRAGKSTGFVEFMLGVLDEQLADAAGTYRSGAVRYADRIVIAQRGFGTRSFSRKDYLALFKEISAPTASRDLKRGVDEGRLDKSGDKRLSTYRFR